MAVQTIPNLTNAPGSVSAVAMPWFCINTHAKKEFVAQSNCVNQGFNTFLPTFIHTYPKKGNVILPLFPSYLFVEFDPDIDVWFPLCHTLGVKKLFAQNPPMNKKTKEYGYIRPTPIDDKIITSLKEQVNAPIKNNRTTTVISAGLTVRVITPDSAFENLEGVCTWSTTKRVGLLMDAMNGKVEISFARHSVELVA